MLVIFPLQKPFLLHKLFPQSVEIVFLHQKQIT